MPQVSFNVNRLIHVWHVRKWARSCGIANAVVRELYFDALLWCASRLIQGLYREDSCACVVDRDLIILGADSIISAATSGQLPFKRIEITELPRFTNSTTAYKLRSAGAFLCAVSAVAGSFQDPFRRASLRGDFQNSFANALLNRLLIHVRQDSALALEPAYQGHHNYPFPCLRIGPSLSDIVGCSNLTAVPVDLVFLEVAELILVSEEFDNNISLFRRAFGLNISGDSALIPVHPWQLSTSKVLQSLLEAGKARLARFNVKVVPLASQRTCRVLSTGYDVKLSVDAFITGERRLLYRLNCENATTVASVLEDTIDREGMSEYFTGQFDVASVFHPLPLLSPSLAAIVRAPHRVDGRITYPAINLWTGRCAAGDLLPSNKEHVEDFFEQYCYALIRGPLKLLMRCGIATEPHLQNAMFEFDHGMPRRLVLRDLDASVFDAKAWTGDRGHSARLSLSKATWQAMPSFIDGSKRTIYSMFYGHLGPVISFLAQKKSLPIERLVRVMDSAWKSLVDSEARSRREQRFAEDLLGYREAVRISLEARVHREAATLVFH